MHSNFREAAEQDVCILNGFGLVDVLGVELWPSVGDASFVGWPKMQDSDSDRPLDLQYLV
jgi:hypothetical protein